MWKMLLLAAAIELPALVDEDVLEPSVQNEVDHALSLAPTNNPAVQPFNLSTFQLFNFPSNGLSKTDLAIRLVSAQKADGRWYCGTNDVTAAAVQLLQLL